MCQGRLPLPPPRDPLIEPWTRIVHYGCSNPGTLERLDALSCVGYEEVQLGSTREVAIKLAADVHTSVREDAPRLRAELATAANSDKRSAGFDMMVMDGAKLEVKLRRE